MLVLTAISQFGVTPAIHRAHVAMAADDGSSGESIEQTTDPRRNFDRLHAWSVRLEGGVLILGIGVIGLMARSFQE